MRIQELAQGIHDLTRKYQLPELMYKAFDVLPEMKVTPHVAWQQELRGQTEEILLNEMVGRVSANMILPYPPGVPLVLPGEMVTDSSRLCWISWKCCAKSARITQVLRPTFMVCIAKKMALTP